MNNYNIVYSSDYLAHHGILGQKWGVRRYQNEDGSLTEAGKKRYETLSPDKLRKELNKNIRSERSKQTNSSRQWEHNNSIGEHSKAAQEKYYKDREKYEESSGLKDIYAQRNKLWEQYNQGKIDDETFDKRDTILVDKANELEDPSFSNFYYIRGTGREYVKEYLDSYGKEINIGYLRDLGFSRETAEYLNNKVMLSNKKLVI